MTTNKKLLPIPELDEEKTIVSEGGQIPATVAAAGQEVLNEPSPAPAPKPVMNLGQYGFNNPVTPDVVGNQIVAPWYSSDFGKYKGTVGQPQTAKRYDLSHPQNPAFIPNPVKIYQQYGLNVVQSNGQAGINDPDGNFHPLLPGSYFAHNVPNAVWTPDGRIIQAQSTQEFFGLLYYLTNNGGADHDPNIERPTRAYSLQELKQWQEQGDETSVRVALSENVRAGNVTQDQANSYVNGEKSLDQIAAETNYQLGKVNNNPIKFQDQAMTAQDYLKWAADKEANHIKSQWTIEDGLNMYATTADYLRMAQDEARKAINKERLAYIKENGSADGFVPTVTVPQIPDNWTDWDEIPAEFKAWLPDLPADALYSPKQYKAYLEPMMRSLETDIDKKLTGGWKSKVTVPNWANPQYEIRYITPDGTELDRHGVPIGITPETDLATVDSIYNFTNNDVEGFVTWALDKPQDYTSMMVELQKVNPALTKLLMSKAGYTDDAGNHLNYTDDQLNRVALQAIEPPTGKWGEFLQIFPDFWGKIQQTDNEYKPIGMAMQDFFESPDNPDRVKDLILDLVSPQTTGIKQIGNIFQLVFSDVWMHILHGASYWNNEPYRIWSQEASFPTGGYFSTKVLPLAYGITEPGPIGTREEIYPWLNPAQYIGAGEIVSILRGIKIANVSDAIILKMASSIIKGESKVKIATDYSKIFAKYAKYRNDQLTEVMDAVTNLDKAINVNDWEKAMEYEKLIRDYDRIHAEYAVADAEATAKAADKFWSGETARVSTEAKQTAIDTEMAGIKGYKGWDDFTYAVNNKDELAAKNEFQKIKTHIESTGALPEGQLEFNSVYTDAEKLAKSAIAEKIAPSKITVPEAKPAIGLPYDPAATTTDAAGNLIKTENTPYRKLLPDEVVPEGVIEKEGIRYVPETPEGKYGFPSPKEKPPTTQTEGTTTPTEGVKPQGEAAGGQREGTAGVAQTEKMKSPTIAEIDAKLAAAKEKIKAHVDSGIFEKGAINDPATKQAYNDLLEVAGLYVQKGIKTVEEFAKELGVKVNDLVKQAWEEATAAKGSSDELKSALGISDETPIPAGKRILSEAEKKAASDEMVKRLKIARELVPERKGSVSELRARQTAAGSAADESAGYGLKGYKAAGEAQKGEARKVGLGLDETNYDEATIDFIINTPRKVYEANPAVFHANRKGKHWDVRGAQESLLSLMKGESLQKAQVEHLEKVYGIEFIKTVKNTPKGLALDILGIPKSLMAFLDHSFPGRQGWIINSANPEIFWKNIKDATGAFWNEGYFNNLKQRVMEDPNFKISKAWGIEYTFTGMDRLLREESFPSRIMDKVPGMEQSNRSFTWAGNAQRLDAWNKYSKWLGPDATDEELKGLASFINKATGRGELGKATTLAEELNTILFSPKLFASRLQTPLMGITSAIPTKIGAKVGLAPYSKRLQAIYWRNVGTSIGVTITTLGLLKGLSELPAFKDKIYIETDLRSSDIGKAVIGDTHIDLTGGNGQLIYLLARMAMGTRKSGGSNEYDTTAAIELQRYLRYKGAPVASIATDWAVGKDVMGNPFGTAKYWLGKIPFPLAIADVYDAISISGLGGAAVLPLTVYGVGVNTYEPRATTEEKRLGTPKYSATQLMEAAVKANEKYTKPGMSDPVGEKAVQTTLSKLAEDKYTLADYRTYLRTAGVSDYKNSKLQQYFKECIPLFDKWQKDEAITGSKLSYTPEERAQAAFWGLDQTKTSSKMKAKQKMTELGLPKEVAPWLY